MKILKRKEDVRRVGCEESVNFAIVMAIILKKKSSPWSKVNVVTIFERAYICSRTMLLSETGLLAVSILLFLEEEAMVTRGLF